MITIKDFKVTEKDGMKYITWDEIKRVLKTKKLNKEFDEFMCGQTCFMDGAYVCDVENFLRPKSRRFFD